MTYSFQNPAFAKPESNSDVVSFYRQFQMAPPLAMFDNQPTLEETLVRRIWNFNLVFIKDTLAIDVYFYVH